MPSFMPFFIMPSSRPLLSALQLTFHRDLITPLNLHEAPYHYAALSGDINLAALLHAHEIPGATRKIKVVSFSAHGTAGATPWSKAIDLVG